MADNIPSSGGSGGAVRTVDNSAYTTSATATAWTQIVKNDFGGETGEALVTVTTPMPTAGTGGYFILSTNNSSTTQLAAGASFTGTIEAIPTALSLSLNVPTDQPLFVTVYGYATSNPLSKISTQQVLVAAGVGMNQAFTVNENFCNVVVQNIGQAPTTTLNVNSQYGPITATDQGGNNPVAIFGTGDLAGINIPEAVVRGDLSYNVTVTNPNKVDPIANGGVVPTDCQGWDLVSGQTITLDTTGYNSISIQSLLGIITVTQSNSNISSSFQGISDIMMSSGNANPTNAVASGLIGAMPVTTRYIKLSIPNAAGNGGKVYLRSAQAPVVYFSGGTPVDLMQLNGSAFSSAGAFGGFAVGGPVAENVASISNPLIAGGIVRTAALGALTAAATSRDTMTSGGAKVMYPYAVPDVSQRYTTGTAGLAVNTSTSAFAAGAAGIRNYVTDIHVTNTVATAQSIAVLDGGTVIWAATLPSTIGGAITVSFNTPLRGTAATAMNVQLTAATATLINLTGFQAP